MLPQNVPSNSKQTQSQSSLLGARGSRLGPCQPQPCVPGTLQPEVRPLRAAPPSGGVSCCAAGADFGAPPSPCSWAMSSCTSPSSSSSPTCCCLTSARRRRRDPELLRSSCTSGSSPWCWKSSDRWVSVSSKPHKKNKLICFH